ncbi:hypothetical protein GALMADRAFT_24345, partial [Galerina marginata CBS 339.88]
NTRSRWDIVWSCLATIFVCTWVSVHPNIPPLGESWWKKSFRRLELMFWSIIAPELMIFWATNQWTAARILAKKYKEYGWTMSHGYFIQMGGFMLYDNNKPIGVLDPDELDRLIEDGKIVMPRTTEQEIQDRSKSDGLSKALVVIQTTWFIGQCIARRAKGLITTELELATLAFAAVNGFMYMFWWFKPLDVQTTVRVDLCPPRLQNVPVDPAVLEANVDKTDISHIQQEFPSSELALPPTPSSITELRRNNMTRGLIGKPYIRSSVWWLMSGILFRWPAYGIKALITRVREIILSNTIDKGAMGVPMFYVSGISNEFKGWEWLPVAISIPFVGILFGAIHLAAWNFSFPSLIETNIWRVSSLIITSVPVMYLVVEIYVFFLVDYPVLPKSLKNNSRVQKMLNFLGSFMLVVLSAALLLYIVARLALLVVALTTLRDLPPEALAAVKWTLFLPHI